MICVCVFLLYLFENKNFIDGKIVKDENEDEIELKLVKPFNRYETVELNLDL